MLKRILTFSFAVAFLSLTSCASVVRGSKENFTFLSNPEGAKLEIFDQNNMLVANVTTPAQIALKKGAGFFKGQTYSVKVTKEGYKPSSFRIDNNVNIGAYVIGNIFLGGVLGILVIDPITGAMWNLEANNFLSSNGSVQNGADNTTLVTLEKEN